MREAKVIILCLFIIIQSFVVIAQTNGPSERKQFAHAIGFGAGYSTGNGISYRYFPSKFGFQVNLGRIGINYISASDVYRSYGVTALYKLVDYDYTYGNVNLYLYQGNSYNYHYSFYEDYPNYPPEYLETTWFMNCLGVGTDIFFHQYYGLNFMLGFAMKNKNTDTHPLSYSTSFGATAECTVYLKF